MADETRSTTIRMPVQLADGLALIARVDGLSMTEQIVEAVSEHVAAKLKDPQFARRARLYSESTLSSLDELRKQLP